MADSPATRAAKRQQWTAIIDEWQTSGLSKAAFCRDRELQLWQFHYWCRRLRELATEEQGASGAFVRLPDDASRPAGSGVWLTVGQRLRIELAADFDAATLKRVLAVVGQAC